MLSGHHKWLDSARHCTNTEKRAAPSPGCSVLKLNRGLWGNGGTQGPERLGFPSLLLVGLSHKKAVGGSRARGLKERQGGMGAAHSGSVGEQAGG